MTKSKLLLVCSFLFLSIVQAPIFSDYTFCTTLPNGGGVKWVSSENDSTSSDTLLAIPAKRSFSHPPFSSKFGEDFSLVTEYDRFNNQTMVTIYLDLIQKWPFVLRFYSFFTYEGTTPAPPSRVVISFHSMSDDWEFLNNSHLVMLIDGKRKDFGKMEHDGNVGSGYVSESMSLALPTEEFLEIINAKDVEGRLFTTEYKLSYAQLEALRDFASRMK